MTSSPFFNMLWSQLLYQLPHVLVALVGMILGLIFWRRSPAACLFALLGCGILFLVGVTWPFLNAWSFSSHMDRGWSAVRYGQVMAVIGGVGTVLSTIGQILVLVAVFVGRRAPAPAAGAPPPV